MRQTNKKKLIALSLVLVVLIGSAFAYLAMQTGIIDNKFKVGSSGAKLIETFNNVTYEGEVDAEDDGFAEAVMTPGNSYTKDLRVQFTGDGKAAAFIKITVPNDTTSSAVDENGIAQNDKTSVVSMNILSGTGEGSDQWIFIGASEEDTATEYIYGYNKVLSADETTFTSLECGIDIVNYYISNNEMPDDIKKEYLVPVTAYTVQYPDVENLLNTSDSSIQEQNLLKIWNDTNLSSVKIETPTTVIKKATVNISISREGVSVGSTSMTLADGEILTWDAVKEAVGDAGYDTTYAGYYGLELPMTVKGGKTYSLIVGVE